MTEGTGRRRERPEARGMPITSSPNAGRAQLQDTYLAEVKRQGIAVTVYLVNGFQLRGTVQGYDAFTIVLEYEHRMHLIYKHAVSTISPQTPLTLPE